MTMRTRTSSFTIDLDDTALESVASRVDSAVSEHIDRLTKEVAVGRICNIAVLALNTAYSQPESGSYRDFHYSERGLLVVITYEEA